MSLSSSFYFSKVFFLLVLMVSSPSPSPGNEGNDSNEGNKCNSDNHIHCHSRICVGAIANRALMGPGV